MNKTYLKAVLYFFLLGAPSVLFAQNIAINSSGTAGNAAAVLDLSDASNSSLGFAMTNVSIGNVAAAAPLVAPPTGLIVFNTNAATTGGLGVGFYYWSGVKWVYMYNSGTLTLSPTAGYVTRWTTATNLGTGVLQDNGTGVSISTTALTPVNTLDVKGNVAIGTYAGTAGPTNGMAVSGQVSVGTTTPNASAAVDIESTTQGFLPPQMTTAQMNAIASPATGLMIYNTTTGCNELYSGGSWQQMGCPCTAPPAEPGVPSGSTTPCASSSSQIYSIIAIPGASLYNWNVPAGTTITAGSGTTAITVTFGTISGTISVSANNSCGSSIANSTSITLTPTPAITVQPGNSTVCTTGTAIFSVTATGTGLTYQWYQFSGGSWSIISNGGVFSGATSNTLTISAPTATMNGYQYECTVSGTCTPSVTSSAATLTVNSLPSITSQPVSASVCNNANASFAVVAAGSGLTYQWQEFVGASWTNLTNSGIFSGTTTATLTLTNPSLGVSGTTYRCVVNGTCASPATTSTVTLTVNSAPTITAQPTAPAAICSGGGTANFTVAATGSGLTYQWYEYITGWNPITNGSYYSGATTTTLTLTNPPSTMSGYLYECIVSGAGPCSTTTNSAALTVYKSYVPITITNSQATATSSNFQQQITVNSSTYSAYENSGLQNIEFSTGPGGTGTILYAWIESGATSASTSTVYWVNLGTNTIAGSGGTLTIYMNFMSSAVMGGNTGYTGEAPQLYGGGYYSTSYAQNDNGTSVFGIYDNFNGTSLSGSWTTVAPAGSVITVNNGVTATTTTATYGGIIYTTGYSNSPVQVFDCDVTTLAAAGIAQGIGLQNGALSTSGAYTMNDWGGGTVCSGTMSGGLNSQKNPTLAIAVGVEGGAWTGAAAQVWYKNYTGTAGSLNVYALPSTVYPAIGMYYSSAGSSITVQWARSHLYAPSGVMPGVAFGAITCP